MCQHNGITSSIKNNIIDTYIFWYTLCVYKSMNLNIFSDLRKPGLVSGESLSLSTKFDSVLEKNQTYIMSYRMRSLHMHLRFFCIFGVPCILWHHCQCDHYHTLPLKCHLQYWICLWSLWIICLFSFETYHM